MRSPRNTTSLALLSAIAAVAIVAPATTQGIDPAGRSILFVRGADGSGGATEGGTFQQRTEQLGDVNNTSTALGNHGFATLAAALVADGFTVTQRIESSAVLTLNDLLPHRVVVMGSNNRPYAATEVKAFHDYIDRGGSALFASDANWGPTWEAAPSSDNAFLARYGAQVYQDSGHLPSMARSTAGRYMLPNHPALSGSDGAGGNNEVNDYNGEGVSLFRLTQGSAGYQAVAAVSATGLGVRLNTTSGNAGAVQPAGPNDAAMIIVTKGQSRILGHFDRNTFFNLNGAGTDLHKLDNRQLALNIFRYLASVPAVAVPVGPGCATGTAPALAATAPILGRTATLTLTSNAASRPGWVLFAAGGPNPFPVGGGCTVHPDLTAPSVMIGIATDATGSWSMPLPIPDALALSAFHLTAQAALLVTTGPLAGNGELSNGLGMLVGHPE